MNCPTCNAPMKVMMTTQLSLQVNRIRRCENGHTFSTCESFDSSIEEDKRRYNSGRGNDSTSTGGRLT